MQRACSEMYFAAGPFDVSEKIVQNKKTGPEAVQ